MKDSCPMHASDMLIYTVYIMSGISVWNGPIYKLISIKLLHGYCVWVWQLATSAGRGGLMFVGIYAIEDF